ncbi:ribosomal protein l17 domain-containing protein [Ditylenchus destructor]|uniref:Large ribosomal subunit protein bL17m n=1 Tax=Ditylenchus destructor TaxID=166010 RepID=A0AAD4NDK2_9BILA|nr:ribosomal protein l17 domain-containing protein [Ditylenchus destructor]
MAQRLFPSLPRLKVPIGHAPQRLKTPNIDPANGRARIEVLRRMVNQVIREERCEFKFNRAEECRQYVERLLQIGVYRGLDNEYTMDMMKWWLIEEDNLDKMFNILIPRYKDDKIKEPWTAIYRLPKMRLKKSTGNGVRVFVNDIAVLELKGNPFPSIEPIENERLETMKEYVKSQIYENRSKFHT